MSTSTSTRPLCCPCACMPYAMGRCLPALHPHATCPHAPYYCSGLKLSSMESFGICWCFMLCGALALLCTVTKSCQPCTLNKAGSISRGAAALMSQRTSSLIFFSSSSFFFSSCSSRSVKFCSGQKSGRRQVPCLQQRRRVLQQQLFARCAVRALHARAEAGQRRFAIDLITIASA